MVYKGKPYEQMDDLGGPPPIFGNTHMYILYILYIIYIIYYIYVSHISYI